MTSNVVMFPRMKPQTGNANVVVIEEPVETIVPTATKAQTQLEMIEMLEEMLDEDDFIEFLKSACNSDYYALADEEIQDFVDNYYELKR